MKYEKPELKILELYMTDIVATSDGLIDKGDNDEDTGSGGMDLTGASYKF